MTISVRKLGCGFVTFPPRVAIAQLAFYCYPQGLPTPNPSPKEGRGRLAQEVLTWKYSNPSVKQPSTPGILLCVSHHLPSKERSQGWGCNFLCLWLLYAGFTPPHTPPQRGTGKSFGTWCLRVIAGKVSVAVGCLPHPSGAEIDILTDSRWLTSMWTLDKPRQFPPFPQRNLLFPDKRLLSDNRSLLLFKRSLQIFKRSLLLTARSLSLQV